ncbi:SMAD/FHA domain-containing protein [Pavlovales sp. CCMP2436]|nr:SMAD/FHA domain-containing protein [Pavlovales sp. CCMP2436]
MEAALWSSAVCIRIGRAPDVNEVVIDSALVSRGHAELTRVPIASPSKGLLGACDAEARPIQWQLCDLGSANGSWVEGRRLRKGEARPLKAGEHVTFGPPSIDRPFAFIFRQAAAAETAAAVGAAGADGRAAASAFDAATAAIGPAAGGAAPGAARHNG